MFLSTCPCLIVFNFNFLPLKVSKIIWGLKFILVLVRGVATGAYTGIYTPKISNRFVHVWDINTF